MKYGINKDISIDAYHKDTRYLSSSSLKLLLEDIEMFKRKYIDKEEIASKSTKSLRTGNYIHTFLLEPDKLDMYTVYEGIRRGKEWNKFKAENEDKIIITPADLSLSSNIATLLPEKVEELLTGGEAETTICRKYKGIDIKVRPDYINFDKGYIVDVKTTRSLLDIQSLKYEITKWKYELSAALYCNIADVNDFYFLFICKDPVDIRIIKAGKSVLEYGNKLIDLSLQNYEKCCKIVDSDIMTIELD